MEWNPFEALEPRLLLDATASVMAGALAAPEPFEVEAADVILFDHNTSDFDRNGVNDLVFRDPTEGSNRVLRFNSDGEPISIATLQGVNDSDWRIIAVADFSGDTLPDLLFRDIDTGANRIFRMNGSQVVGITALPTTPPAWRLGGVGDFTGDGDVDLYWQHLGSGRQVIWQMNETIALRSFTVPRLPDANWIAAGVGDFTGDGNMDVLYRNQRNDLQALWSFDGITRDSTAWLGRWATSDWQIGEVKDLDADGDPDLAWRNLRTGATSIWYLEDLRSVATLTTTVFDHPNWQLPGTSTPPFGEIIPGDSDDEDDDDVSFHWRSGPLPLTFPWHSADADDQDDESVNILSSLDALATI